SPKPVVYTEEVSPDFVEVEAEQANYSVDVTPEREGTISYEVPSGSPVLVAMTDRQGNEIKILETAWKAAGKHYLHVDTKGIKSGLYLIKIQTPETEKIQVFQVEG
ncbi:MAG: hypothetical protein AAF206_04145, partial [Bacteroidota bacterium]